MKEVYYIYHIPGKKIGVTRDLNNRVTLVQGYKPKEYEVLDSSSDINYISTREIELQKFYGYKVDRTLYKNLVNKKNGKVILAKINVDENQGIAGQLNIQSIPTVYGFVEGKPVDAFQGAQPESKIEEMIDKLRSRDSDRSSAIC